MCHIQENVTYSDEDHSYSDIHFQLKNMSMEKNQDIFDVTSGFLMYLKTRLEITFYL